MKIWKNSHLSSKNDKILQYIREYAIIETITKEGGIGDGIINISISINNDHIFINCICSNAN